jgi:hypothetical protein
MVWLFACIFTLQIKKYILCLYIHPHLEKHPWICWWAGLECGPARPCGYFTLKIVCIYRHICTCMSVCLPVCLPVCLIYTYIFTVWLSRWTLHRVSVLVALGGLHVHWQASYHCLKPGTEECHICMYIYIYEFLSKNIYICMPMQARLGALQEICIHLYIYYIWICIYICIYIYTFI